MSPSNARILVTHVLHARILAFGANTLALPGADSHTTSVHYQPGATHHARWIGEILYCQKMYLWSEQMAYTPERVNLFARINAFLAIFYVPL